MDEFLRTIATEQNGFFLITLIVLYGVWIYIRNEAKTTREDNKQFIRDMREDYNKFMQKSREDHSNFIKENMNVLNINIEKLMDENKTAHQYNRAECKEANKKLDCVKRTVTIMAAKQGT